ncbi:MAG: response regulator transcription factor [Peptoniphilaceae bacterium]|nr:response regulator transcription factor [Peptoniphilaceae bacterium]MDD7433994.1 response regulator transcription factor [Peptoniphilaceae bacterium]MDY3075608.1 response regulator transcription factor [Peptoniphilaceae bacterium]MDY4196462.1 response regulator transcription factor [Peptoniphilaceae bacterium]
MTDQSTKKILLVDDEPGLLELLRTILQEAGFTHLVTAASVKEALEKARAEEPELAILDVMLPDGDGFTLLRQMRSITQIPVIFLTAKDASTDKLQGLSLGADDYVVKPFLPEELILRIQAILKRSYPEADPRVFLAHSVIDFSKAEVQKDGETLSLTAKEFTLLETLARNKGRIVTMDALIEAMWGENPFGYENSLNAHVRRVREKIERNPSKPESLITIKGLGYKLLTEKPS